MGQHKSHASHQANIRSESCGLDLDLTVDGRHDMLENGLSNWLE